MANEIMETNTQSLVAESSENDVVGFGTYFGTSILFSIPVVGWIASIVFSFAPKRRSLKNYARVMMVWTTLGLVTLAAIATVLLTVINHFVVQPLNQQLGTEFSGIIEIVQVSQDLKEGKYSTVFKHFGNQFPEEMQPLVQELATGEYDEFIGMVSDGDYAGAAAELESGEHEKLKEIVGEERYEKAVEELKKATEEDKHEWIEKVEEITNFNPLDFVGRVLG